MANVIEIAKAALTAYNDKDWSKAKDTLAADAVYDEKGTHRRIQGAGEIIEAWEGWAKAFPRLEAHNRARVCERGPRGLGTRLEGRSHRTAADTDRYDSGIEQADRDAGMPGRPGRGRQDQERGALLRHAHDAHTDRSH